MKPIKHTLTLLLFLLIITNPVFAQETDEKYLLGAVPEIEGKVQFAKTIHLPGIKKEAIFTQLEKWMENNFNTINSRVVFKDSEKGQIVALGNDTIVFKSTFLSLDQTNITYQFLAECKDTECNIQVDKIFYNYGVNERFTAEEMITDHISLNKKGTKVVRGYAKWRINTIDYIESLFENVTEDLFKLKSTALNAEQKTNTPKSIEPTIPIEQDLKKPEQPSLSNYSTSKNVELEVIFASLTTDAKNTQVIIQSDSSAKTIDYPSESILIGHYYQKPVLQFFAPFSSELYSLLENNNSFSLALKNKSKEYKIGVRKILTQSITPESVIDLELKEKIGSQALQKIYIAEITFINLK